MFNMVKRISTCVIMLILLSLFIFPSLYLSRFAEDALAAIEAMEAAASDGNAHELRIQTDKLHERAEQAADGLRLFICHECVDDMLLAVSLVDPEAERDDLRSALIAARMNIEHLRGIELFEWDTLL